MLVVELREMKRFSKKVKETYLEISPGTTWKVAIGGATVTVTASDEPGRVRVAVWRRK